MEFVEVIDKDVGAGEPLPVEFAPHSLPPPGIGKGKMKRGLIKVMPVFSGDDMS
jgi:hypothetical protein